MTSIPPTTAAALAATVGDDGWCDLDRPHSAHGITWDNQQQAWCPGIPGWAAAVGLPPEAETGVGPPFGCPHLQEIGALRSRAEAMNASMDILARECEHQARLNDRLLTNPPGDPACSPTPSDDSSPPSASAAAGTGTSGERLPGTMPGTMEHNLWHALNHCLTNLGGEVTNGDERHWSAGWRKGQAQVAIAVRDAVRPFLADLTAQRNLAREVAVALEQQIAQAAGYHREYAEYGMWPHQCATCGTVWPCRTWRALHPETARSSVTGEWELADVDPEATP